VLISYDGSTHAHNNGQNLVSVFDSHHEEIVDIYANKTLLSTEGYGVDVNKFNEQKNILMNQ
jgi:hypothetical protein